jgi:hypothetical protein
VVPGGRRGSEQGGVHGGEGPLAHHVRAGGVGEHLEGGEPQSRGAGLGHQRCEGRLVGGGAIVGDQGRQEVEGRGGGHVPIVRSLHHQG